MLEPPTMSLYNMHYMYERTYFVFRTNFKKPFSKSSLFFKMNRPFRSSKDFRRLPSSQVT